MSLPRHFIFRSVQLSVVLLCLWQLSPSAYAQLKRAELRYFDRDGTGSARFFSIPASFNDTSTIISYRQIFTSPFKTTYLDSIRVRLSVMQLDDGDTLLFSVHKPRYENDRIWTGASIRGKYYLAIDPLEEEFDLTVPFDHVQVEGDFVIAVWGRNGARLRLVADEFTSEEPLDYDPARDRSILRTETGERYMRNTRWGGQPEYHYPNFYITAFVAGTGTSGVEDGAAMPLSLEQNAPNPCSTSTMISFELKERGHTTLTVHDLLGREVARLCHELLPPGSHSRLFEHSLPEGVYSYTLFSNGRSLSRKFTVQR